MNVLSHPANCVCDSCCAARAAEVRRRLEDVRREQKRVADLASVELAPMAWKPKKAQPGTLPALVKIGRAS